MAEQKPRAILVPKAQAGAGDELTSLCKMMHIMSERDVDATLVQVLKTMMVHTREQPLGGSELSKISGINRITIIHHLKRLEGAGFVQRKEGKYAVRVQSAEDMLMEFRKEMERTFAEMDELAREIDGQFDQMERIGAAAFERPSLSPLRKRGPFLPRNFCGGKNAPICLRANREAKSVRSKRMERAMLENQKKRRLP